MRYVPTRTIVLAAVALATAGCAADTTAPRADAAGRGPAADQLAGPP